MKENNKLIAEFMGFKPLTNGTMRTSKEYGGSTIGESDTVLFQTSWDWLMPVVEKIESLRFSNNVFYNFHILGGCQVYIIGSDMAVIVDVSAETKLLSVYLAAIKFINWYNQHDNSSNSGA